MDEIEFRYGRGTPLIPRIPAQESDAPEASNGAKRHDQGKTRWDLLPFDALNAVAEVSTDGAVEYGERNWELGMAWSRIVGSFFRHLFARMRGEILCPKSGHHHTAHLAWNALAMCAYDLRGIGENNLHLMAPPPKEPCP